ncbi:MAG: preprotein translocase subunit SecG, partial [Pedobacter sp.]
TLGITTITKNGGGATAVGNSAIQERLDKTPAPSPLGGSLNNTTPAKPATADTTKK